MDAKTSQVLLLNDGEHTTVAISGGSNAIALSMLSALGDMLDRDIIPASMFLHWLADVGIDYLP